MRQAEVQNLDVAIRSNHYVFRLDVAMYNAAFMRRGERQRDLCGLLDEMRRWDEHFTA